MKGKHSTVFIAFRLLVCLGPGGSAGGLPPVARSSLPFGFWSVWDMKDNVSDELIARVFIAFRLLVCLGRNE